MELGELVGRIQNWHQINADKQLGELEQCAESKDSACSNTEEIIQNIRRAIEAGKSNGADMSEREKRLAELEEKVRALDNKK